MVIPSQKFNIMFIIYKILFISGKVYIGQTTKDRFKVRIREHLKCAKNGVCSKVYNAIRKYNTTKSDFSIIEENIETRELADIREKYWIEKYNSFYNGYNSTLGGTDNYQKITGEESPVSILSNEEVFNIRKMKSEMKYTKEYIYSLYSNRISKSGFHKIWNYESYPNVATKLNTKEIIEYYIHTKPKGSNNKNCIFSKEEIEDIRIRYFVNVESSKNIASIYNVNKSTIERIVSGKTYFDYPFPKPFFYLERKNIYIQKKKLIILLIVLLTQN